MGFLAGLGSGFSTSFNEGMARNDARKRDAFRVAYDAYVDKKSKYDQEEKDWKQALKAGEAIVSRYPDAPAEASVKAAEWIQAGFTTKQVDEMIATSKFAVTPNVAAPSDPSKAPQMVDTMGDQTVASGLAPAPAPTDPTVAPTMVADDATSSNPMASIFGEQGIFKNAGKSPEEKAQARLQQTLGMSPEEFSAVNSGFQRPTSNLNVTSTGTSNGLRAELGFDENVTSARYIAAELQVQEWENSDDPALKAKALQARSILKAAEEKLAAQNGKSPEELAELISSGKVLDQLNMETAKMRSTAKTVASQAMELDRMAREADTNILTSVTGGVSMFETAKDELSSLLEYTVGQLNSSDAAVNDSSIAKALDAAVTKVFGDKGKTELAAQQYREFTAAQVRFIYAAGKALGQAGNGFSDKDYKNIREAIMTSTDYEAFSNNLKRFSLERFMEADSEQEIINNTIVAQLLSADERFGPMAKKSMMSSEEMYGDTPEWQWANSDFVPRGATEQPTPNPQQVDTEQPAPEQAGPTVPPEWVGVVKGITDKHVGKRYIIRGDEVDILD